MNLSIKKTSINTIYKCAKHLKKLSERRVIFNNSYDSSIMEMRDIFQKLNCVKRNLRNRAKDNYMRALYPYLRSAHYDPKFINILVKTAKKVVNKENNSRHEQQKEKRTYRNKSTKVYQQNLLNINKNN